MLAVWHRRTSGRIDDLHQEVVLPQVHSAARAALEGHPRAVHLGETVGIIGFEPVDRLDLLAHLLRMRLGAEEGNFDLRVPPWINVELLEDHGEMEGVTGDNVDHRRLEIPHHLNLALAVAGAGRDDKGADLLRPVMKAQTTRK